MGKALSKTGIVDGQIARAAQVTQSIDAFTAQEAYDIEISGSLGVTGPLSVTGSTDLDGNLAIPGFPNVSASLAASGVGNGFPYTGSAEITGSLELTGSYNILASEGSNLTFEVNESASFEFLTGAPNTGSFIVQTSPDTGKGALQSYFGQGTGTVFGQPVPNQAFGLKYTSGSNASEGELSMTFGKRDLSSLSSANQNNFYVAYEPAGIFTNAQGELEFYVGEHANVGSGVLSVYRGGASGATQTSSYAGYFSSSAFPGQQQYTRPFAISATSTVSDSNSAFVINKNVTDLTTSNFSVDYGGNVTASGNISASGEVESTSLRVGETPDNAGGLLLSSSTFDGDTRDTQIIYPTHGLHFNSSDSDNHVLALAGNRVGVRIQPDSGNAALTVSGSVNVIDGNITGSAIGNPGQVIRLGGATNFIDVEDGGDSTMDFIGGETNIKYSTLFFKDAQDGATIYLQGSNGSDNVRMQFGDPEFESTGFQFDLNIGNASAHFSGLDVTGSKHGLFQAGKPIVTHTSSPISASLANAGKYHIVSGDLTASIVINSSTPVGAEYEFFQSSSAGQFLFESASGTTVISKNGSMRLAQQGSSAVLKKVSSTTFHLMGDLT